MLTRGDCSTSVQRQFNNLLLHVSTEIHHTNLRNLPKYHSKSKIKKLHLLGQVVMVTGGWGVTLAMVSLSVSMLTKKSEVGWAWQSVIGQLQFMTRFCSILAVRYSCQQDCTHTHTPSETGHHTEDQVLYLCERLLPGSSSACSSARGPAPCRRCGGPGRRGRWRRGSVAAEDFGTWARRPWWGRRGRRCIAAPTGPRSTYNEPEGARPGPGPDSESPTPEGAERDKQNNPCL